MSRLPISIDSEFTFGGVPCLVVTTTGARPTAWPYVIGDNGNSIRPLVDDAGQRVEFIGRANRLDGHVHAGRFHIEGQDAGLPIDDDYEGPAILMTRPHDLALLGEGGEGFEARVVDFFRRADRITAELECAGQARTLELDLEDGPDAALPRVGDVVRIRPLRASVYPAR